MVAPLLQIYTTPLQYHFLALHRKTVLTPVLKYKLPHGEN